MLQYEKGRNMPINIIRLHSESGKPDSALGKKERKSVHRKRKLGKFAT